MGFLDNVLKVFVGDKSKKDIGDIQPLVEEVKKFEGSLEKLSLDEIRSKSERFREIIKEDQRELQQQIDQLHEEAELMQDIDKKEDIYNKIDALMLDRYEIEKETLLKILPEAFAVMKETAKRFKDNENLVVTAMHSTVRYRERMTMLHSTEIKLFGKTLGMRQVKK